VARPWAHKPGEHAPVPQRAKEKRDPKASGSVSRLEHALTGACDRGGKGTKSALHGRIIVSGCLVCDSRGQTTDLLDADPKKKSEQRSMGNFGGKSEGPATRPICRRRPRRHQTIPGRDGKSANKQYKKTYKEAKAIWGPSRGRQVPPGWVEQYARTVIRAESHRPECGEGKACKGELT